MKLQETHNPAPRIFVTIPQEHIRLLGWNKGDVVMATSDTDTDTITLKRVTMSAERRKNETV